MIQCEVEKCDNLQSGTPFENYTVFEVSVLPAAGQNLQVDRNGVVTGCDPHRLEAGDKLVIGGKPVGTALPIPAMYMTSYMSRESRRLKTKMSGLTR